MKKTVSYHIDRNIPRSTTDQPNIPVGQREYLSRLANLNSKFLGVVHRKKQWDRYTSEHLDRIAKISQKDDLSRYSDLPENSIITISIEHRDVRLENEFNSLIYSISSTLSALTYVISSFIKGCSTMHSHSSLVKLLSKDNKDPELSELVIKNDEDWIDELKTRRDTATHYVSLLLKSKFIRKIENNEITNTENILGIMTNPVKRNFLLHEDIPLLDGTKHKSQIIENNGIKEIKNQIFDINGNLVYECNSENNEDIELSNARIYIDNIYENLESYIIKVLSNLNKRLI